MIKEFGRRAFLIFIRLPQRKLQEKCPRLVLTTFAFVGRHESRAAYNMNRLVCRKLKVYSD
jgi:hypothetical protein